MSKSRKYGKSGFLVGLSLLMGLGLVEIGLRATGWRIDLPEFIVDEGTRSIGNPLHPSIDVDGFRKQDVPGPLCVVLMGDSQIYGFLADRHTLSYTLTFAKGIATYSMAIPGHSPLQHVRLLDQALARGPRIIITAVYFGNDILDAYVFWDELHAAGAGSDIEPLMGFTPRPAQDLAELEGSAEVFFEILSQRSPHLEYLLSLARRSRVFEALYQVKNALLPKDVADFYRLPSEYQKLTHGTIGGTDFFFVNDKHYVEIFENQSRMAQMNLDEPRLAESLAALPKLLMHIHTTTTDNGVANIVLVIPTKERAFLHYLEEAGYPLPQSYKDLIGFEDTARQLVIEHLEANGVPYIDILPLWERSILRGASTHLKDSHPNRHGFALLADAIAATLPADLCAR